MKLLITSALVLISIGVVLAWTNPMHSSRRTVQLPRRQFGLYESSSSVDFDSLMDMDVVLFKKREGDDNNLELGALQEDGSLAPLSAWSSDPAFGDSIEFLVDEEDRFPGYQSEDIDVVHLLPQDVVSYGSRQVGGGKGPGNPHGEESELLYYVDKSVLEDTTYSKGRKIQVVVKPELEILW